MKNLYIFSSHTVSYYFYACLAIYKQVLRGSKHEAVKNKSRNIFEICALLLMLESQLEQLVCIGINGVEFTVFCCVQTGYFTVLVD